MWDVRTRRIPNALTLPMFVAGLVYQIAFNGWAGVGEAAGGFAIGFGMLFILWLVGGGGGGDVKLMGALAVWLGFRNTLYVLVASTLIVAAATFGLVVWSVMTNGVGGTRRLMATGKPSSIGGGSATITAGAIEARQQRRIMAYALPVAVATWAVLAVRFVTVTG
ncbi:MAG: A24 family peptidase [Planctomycetes bacterium]|nr:A24 family peptidase [Planctomycetota bacterium]